MIDIGNAIRIINRWEFRRIRGVAGRPFLSSPQASFRSAPHPLLPSSRAATQATETWLNESIMDHEILPTAYNIYRCDHVGRVGGGVMTAIKSTLSSTLHKVPSEFSSLEIVVVEISNLKYDRSVLL